MVQKTSFLSNNIPKAFDSNYLGSRKFELESVDELVYNDRLAGLFKPNFQVQLSVLDVRRGLLSLKLGNPAFDLFDG